MKKRIVVFGIFTFFIMMAAAAQTLVINTTQGEKLFKENKPKEAVQVLENEILNNQITSNTYNFLGLGYYQLEEYAKSLDAFERGIKAQPSNVKLLSFNKGNTYYAMKDYASAVSAYSQAFLDDTTFYDALLNRANAFLMGDQLLNAKKDYELFLEKCPDDPQEEKIRRIIQAIIDELARREEEARRLAEQNKARWEEVDPTIADHEAGDDREWERVDDAIADLELPENRRDWQLVEAKIEDPEKEPEPEEDVPDWQKVDPKIEDQKVENKTDWEKVNPKIEDQTVEKKPDWQKVESNIESHKEEKKTDWEKMEEVEQNKAIVENQHKKTDEKVDLDKNADQTSETGRDWEALDVEKVAGLPASEEVPADDDILTAYEWENLSDEEAMEIKRLEKESKEAHDRWVKEQSLIKQKMAEEELKKLQEKDDAERLSREKMLKEMMEAEEARRKKLLDDVANSLQNTDSINMTSGADDIIDYDQEGELD